MGPLNRPYGTALDTRTRAQLRQMDSRVAADAERLVWRDRVALEIGGFVVHSRYERGDARWTIAQRVCEYLPRVTGWSWHSTAKAFVPMLRSSDRWTRVQWRDVEIDLSELQRYEQTSDDLELLGVPADRGLNPLVSFKFHDKTLLMTALQLLETSVWPSAWVGESLLHPASRPFVCALPADEGEVGLQINMRRERGPIPYDSAAALAYWHRSSHIEQLHGYVTEPIYREEAICIPRVPGPFKFALDGYMCDDFVMVQSLGYHQLDPCWPKPWNVLSVYDERRRLLGRFSPLPPDSLRALP